MKKLVVLLFFIPLIIFAQEKEDIWKPFKYFVGKWEGTGDGKFGISTAEQEFQFVLRGKYLQMKNKSVFKPQEKNPKGDIHEDIGLFSFDNIRQKYIFRQFNVEGFVNRYVLESISNDKKTFFFF